MPKNLLLADDSITIQKVVGMTFANEDFEVTSVDNGEDALSRARELKPDIIVADVAMPRRNGYEVCEAVKADPGLRHIPVLLLAGSFEAFDESRARQARADGHISKPFESQALINKVKELTGGAAAPSVARYVGPGAPAARPPAQGMPPGVARPGAPMPPGARRPPAPGMMPGAPRPGAPVPPGARPPGAGMPPAGMAARPPGPGMMPGAPRRGGPLPPGARPPGPGMMQPPGAPRPGGPLPPPGSRPPAGAPPQAARPGGPYAPAGPRPAPAARPAPGAPAPGAPAPATSSRRDPFGFGVGAPAQAKAPAPPAREEDFGDVDVGHEREAAAPAAAPRDGGEALLREALSKASREVIERVVWEVVPQLAETIIRENLDRLVKQRQG